MADLDKAARYLAKQDPPGFFTWLWRPAVSPLRFHSWYDARRLAQPDEEDRTCDSVAAFRLLNATAPTHFLIIDFKDQARAAALDQLHDYVVRLSRELRREVRPAPQVGGAVINLTGKPKPRSVTVDFPGVPECAWHFGGFQGATEAQWRAWLRAILQNKLANLTRQYRQTDKRQIDCEFPLPRPSADGETPKLLAPDSSPSARAGA